jgi:hypothetical protein
VTPQVPGERGVRRHRPPGAHQGQQTVIECGSDPLALGVRLDPTARLVAPVDRRGEQSDQLTRERDRPAPGVGQQLPRAAEHMGQARLLDGPLNRS